MKTDKLNWRAAWLGLAWLALLAGPARAQFPALASQTQFICNAPGSQFGVQAFADGAGGAYQVWIDKRGGNDPSTGPGTALYAQHLSAAGTPLLSAGGVRLFQTGSREIFGMRAVAWRGGLLVAWVQGAYSVGGDTVRCQFYNPAGVAQWARPTVVAYRTLPTVLYILPESLAVLPTSTGATITHGLSLGGAPDQFSFNQISFSGALRFANNQLQFRLPGSNVFRALADGHDGLYLVGAYGAFGAELYAQRYDPNGVAYWAAPLTLNSSGASGGGGQEWRVLSDPANNLYVVWGSDGGDILAAQVTPAGARGWPAPGYINLCANPSRQDAPFALWHNNALWVIWDDDRTPSSGSTEYMQRVDAAGTLAWPAAGVLINALPGVYTYPKLAPSDNGAVMAFYSAAYGQGFRAQKIRPDASLAFPVNGVPLHNVQPDQPYALDYVPVPQPNGSVQVFWASPGGAATNRDICAGRVQPTGTLLGTAGRAAVALGFAAYPNPATAGELRLRYPAPGPAPAGLRLYDVRGRLVRAFAAPGPAGTLSLRGLAAGVYVLRAELGGQPVSCRVAVAE